MAENDDPNAPENDGQDTVTESVSESSEAAGQGGDMSFDEFASTDSAPVKEDHDEQRTAHDLEPVFDVPVKVQAVLGRSNLEVSQLLKLAPGAVLELDRKVGEAIDIYVNNRLVARGEVVLVEDHLGVTMTEIVKTDRS